MRSVRYHKVTVIKGHGSCQIVKINTVLRYISLCRIIATGQTRLKRQTGTPLELYVSCNSGQLDFIRHWYIRGLYFLIDSCHGNKLEHRHFVRRVFFPAQSFQMFSLPAGIMLSVDIYLTFLDIEMRLVDRIKKIKRPTF